eukprot:861644-Prorocentrum_lima.AAC.1
MTSSLVGSEMCIRDSNNNTTPPHILMQWSGPRSIGWLGVVVVIVSLIPVSYTHLTLPTICSV